MALSGTLTRDFASYYRLQIEWTATQSQSNNTSTITSKLYLISESQYSTINTSSNRRAWCTIAGNTSYSAYDPNKLDLAGNQKKLMHTYVRTVGHDSNGYLTAALGGGIDWDLNVNGHTGSTVTISGNAVLNRIIPPVQEPPPIKPPPSVTITYPTTRVTFDNSIQVKWTSGSDPQGQALQYEVAYRNKSTNAWTYTSWFTNNNSTKVYTINTTSWVDSTTVQIAVRSKNTSGLTSAHKYTPDLTVKNAVIPLAATALTPNASGDYPPELNTRFTWKLNGAAGQSAYVLEYRKAGVSTWTSTGFITSTRLYHDVPGNTLTAGNYEWRIGHKGADGTVAPWSSYQQFEVLAATTAPTMTKPLVNQIVNNNLIEVEWVPGSEQEAYELRLLEDGVVRFAATVNSSVGAGYITYDIVHGATYTVQVRNKKLGVWSPYAARLITASVASPEVVGTDPDTIITTNPDRGSILLSYTPPVQKLNMLPTFTSGRWTGVTQGAQTTAWQTTWSTDIYIRIPAKPGQLYFGRVIAQTGYRITMSAYNASNGVIGFTQSPTATVANQVLENNIMAPSLTTSVEFRISRPGGITGGIVNQPMLSETLATAWEAGQDTGFTNPVGINIERREYGSEAWITIAKDLALTVGGYEDLTAGSGKLYEYRIITVGTNGLTAATAIFEAQVWFQHAFLHDAINPAIFYRIFLEDAREEELDVKGEIQFFAGRRLPIREYGVHETHQLQIEWIIDSSDELNDLKEQVKKRRPLLYRDNVGRRFFATTNGVQAVDRQIIGHDMSMTLIETDFKEGVD